MYDPSSVRPSWDEVWMVLAETIGRRSRCVRAQIGCVIVSPDNQVISASYNSPPPNYEPANMVPESTCVSWCPRARQANPDRSYDQCCAAHSEQNAISRADWSRMQNGKAYVNGSVCITCAKLLAAAGVSEVHMKVHPTDRHRRPEETVAFLEYNGITVTTVRTDT